MKHISDEGITIYAYGKCIHMYDNGFETKFHIKS